MTMRVCLLLTGLGIGLGPAVSFAGQQAVAAPAPVLGDAGLIGVGLGLLGLGLGLLRNRKP